MNRRRFLTSAGTATLVGAAGCVDRLGGGSEGEYPTESFQGETVPLAPLEDVYEWWDADEARFVDTRGRSQYDADHVPGAVLFPVGSNDDTDPTDGWPSDTRIVTYCDCPHSLAVQRASGLLANGFEAVYALEDGYLAWEDAGHPTESNDPGAEVSTYEIVGTVDSRHAGEYVSITTVEGDNHENVQIGDDGTYEATIRFPNVTEKSELVVETPTYRREGTVAELTSETVRSE